MAQEAFHVITPVTERHAKEILGLSARDCEDIHTGICGIFYYIADTSPPECLKTCHVRDDDSWYISENLAIDDGFGISLL